MHVKKFLLLSVCMSFGVTHAMWRSRVARIIAGVTAARMVDSVATGQRSFAVPRTFESEPIVGIEADYLEYMARVGSQQPEKSMEKCTYQGSVVDACWEVLWACGKQLISVEDDRLYGQEALESLQCAIAKGKDVNAVDKQGSSGLHVLGIALATCPTSGAASRALHMLLEANADAISVRFDDGSTLLHKAAKGGNAAVMPALVQAGLDVNARDTLGRTPLHVLGLHSFSLASSHNINVTECMEKLYELGADVGAQDYEGLTLRRIAETNVIRALFAEGNGVNVVNDSGNTPLIQAVLDGDYVRVQDLLGCGADLTVRNNAGRTALKEAYAKVDASPDDANAREIARLLMRASIDTLRGIR